MQVVLILFIILLNTIKVQAQNTFEKIIDTLGSAGAYSIQETLMGDMFLQALILLMVVRY